MKKSHTFWHPGRCLFDYESAEPMNIVSANGATLHTDNYGDLIDTNSSWWVKTLGHRHPELVKAMKSQLDQFEHVSTAQAVYPGVIALCEKLNDKMQARYRTSFASDGASAVEIAMKMSLHTRLNNGQTEKSRFATLQNGYHGETFATMSVSALDGFTKAYTSRMWSDTLVLAPIPYVSGKNDPLWHDASAFYAPIAQQLEQHAHQLTALLIEPILQGSANMKIISADFLKWLGRWCESHDVHLICDEIASGLGRTGTLFASEHAELTPDFVCLGKGLTGGTVALSCAMVRDDIAEQILAAPNTPFLHSHAYSGNAIGVAAAFATLNVLEHMDLEGTVAKLGDTLLEGFNTIQAELGCFTNIRQIGAVVAAEYVDHERIPEFAKTLYGLGARHGVYIRPHGNTLYWTPPLTITASESTQMVEGTLAALKALACNTKIRSASSF